MSNLDKAFESINKKFGKGTIQMLGETHTINENLLSTGSLLIDQALGGGIGLNRITEIYGVESSGKSTLALHLAAECQKTGGKVAYVDVENALDIMYAKKLGVNVDELLFTQPSSAEEALDIVNILADTGDVRLIVVDSVAALVPQAELDGEMGDVTIGLQARLMSKAMRKITGTLNEKNCAVIFINQIRDKVSTGWSSGPTETTTGGRALKFFASQRIELRKSSAIKEGDKVIGNYVKVKIVKNKIAPPMRVVEIPLIFGKGFSGGDEVIDLAIDYNLIKKAGAWFDTHTGERIQGKAKVKEYYESHKEEYEDLRNIVIDKLKGMEFEPEYELDKNGVVIDD
jgi:recombination protein RecA